MCKTKPYKSRLVEYIWEENSWKLLKYFYAILPTSHIYSKRHDRKSIKYIKPDLVPLVKEINK